MSGWKLIGETLVSPAQTGLGEYDGDILTFTPNGLERGIVPSEMFYRLNAGVVGLNATGAQSVFGVGVTLSAGTVYEFEMMIAISKTSGTTSHSWAFGFGGTATINNIGFSRHSAFSSSSFNPSSGFHALSFFSTATSASINSTETGLTTGPYLINIIKGTVSINAGGTFIPQYTLSAAPGGAYTTQAGSYMKIKPIGLAGANTSVGTWA